MAQRTFQIPCTTKTLDVTVTVEQEIVQHQDSDSGVELPSTLYRHDNVKVAQRTFRVVAAGKYSERYGHHYIGATEVDTKIAAAVSGALKDLWAETTTQEITDFIADRDARQAAADKAYDAYAARHKAVVDAMTCNGHTY